MLVLIDANQNWKNHVDYVAKKIKREGGHPLKTVPFSEYSSFGKSLLFTRLSFIIFMA